jgi:hypothetical protein
MANIGTPSQENPWIVVSEDHPAFRNESAAIRHIKKQWAAQSPAERDRHVLAKIQQFVDPDYDVKVIETPVVEAEEVEAEAKGKR